MKKIMCILLILLLLGGCTKQAAIPENKLPSTNVVVGPGKADERKTPPPDAESKPMVEIPPIEGYESFVNYLSAAVIDGKTNKNLSPMSVYLAVAMAAEGARGETQAELLALLGEEKLEDLRQNAESIMQGLAMKGETGELALANSIWMGIQDGSVVFHEAYLKTLAESYDAKADTVRFGEPEAGQRISQWIQEQTRGKVKVSDDAMRFDADTLAVLVNTIYLKDSWQAPFEKSMTREGTFYGLNGQELTVKYMRRTDRNAAVVQGEGYLRYALSLGEVGRMVFVLPDEGVSLESLLGSPEGVDELLHGGVEKEKVNVDVMVPRFGFQDRTDLEEILMGLGVRTCFSGGADFSAMTDTPAYISRVLQESRIDVNEDGVEAAAYTMIAMAKGAFFMDERETVEFHLTRPFLYAIESPEGTVFFLGSVAAPEEAK